MAGQLATWLDGNAPAEPFVIIDVREASEVTRGRIPGAQHIALGRLPDAIGRQVPDKRTTLVVYCETGTRSRRAVTTLTDLGYTQVLQLDAGISGWKGIGRSLQLGTEDLPSVLLTPQQQERYSRHLRLTGFGEEQQRRLLRSQVLILGLGGLGSPAALYLAAAGVGTLGLLDADSVELSNLQRQVVHTQSRLGMNKVQSAAALLTDVNSDVTTIPLVTYLNRDNVDAIFSQGWDLIVDGCDNFPTRYLVNDASRFHAIPVVHGSVSRFEGRVTTFIPGRGPCYRCLFPEPPPASASQSCEEGGVLGVLPGMIGVLQATEAIKLLLGLGQLLTGRLLTYDALSMEFRTLHFTRNSACPLCGDEPNISTYVDYDELCGGRIT